MSVENKVVNLFRAGLASARRLYLHYTQAGNVDYSRVGRDMQRIVENYERACDEIDRLTLALEEKTAQTEKIVQNYEDVCNECDQVKEELATAKARISTLMDDKLNLENQLSVISS